MKKRRRKTQRPGEVRTDYKYSGVGQEPQVQDIDNGVNQSGDS